MLVYQRVILYKVSPPQLCLKYVCCFLNPLTIAISCYISINPTRLSKLNVSKTWNVLADLEINIILLRNVSP